MEIVEWVIGIIAGLLLTLLGIKVWKGKKDDKNKAESDTPTNYTPSSGVQEHIADNNKSITESELESAKSKSQSNIDKLKRPRDSHGRFIKSE